MFERTHGGDLRLTDTDRKIFQRITSGDLAGEFQAVLDADLAADPIPAVPIVALDPE